LLSPKQNIELTPGIKLFAFCLTVLSFPFPQQALIFLLLPLQKNLLYSEVTENIQQLTIQPPRIYCTFVNKSILHVLKLKKKTYKILFAVVLTVT